MPDKQTAPIKWDKINSTYWWKIILNPEYKSPSTGLYVNHVPELSGYSKAQGHDEARDKEQMLMRKVVMLYTNDFLNRCTEIQFYKRASELGVNKKEDTWLFTLAPKTIVDIAPVFMKPEFNRFVKFLEKFYQAIAEGKNVKSLLPNQKANFSKDEYLDIETQFTKIGTDKLLLVSYCTRLINNRHPFEAVFNFRLKYEEKYLR